MPLIRFNLICYILLSYLYPIVYNNDKHESFLNILRIENRVMLSVSQ